jgi:hypothetical protein
LELHLQGGEILEDVGEVGHPWRAKDDVDVDTDVHQVAIWNVSALMRNNTLK